MKILINRIPVQGPWGGGNLLVKAFCENMKMFDHEVVHSFQEDIDVIFLQDPRPGNTGISINEAVLYRNQNPETKIIQRINECDARKNTKGVDDMLLECSKHIDGTVFVSNWMKNYHIENGWHCKNNIVIYNGVNLNHFKPSKKLENGKINLVTHHWSDNLLKGFDIYEAIDLFVENNSDYTFTYIGRHRNTFRNTRIIEPLFGRSLGTELSKYDVYISASRYDPGPNHVLESLACNIPTYTHLEGGGCVEFSGKDHIFKDYKDLEKMLIKKNFTNNSFNFYSWKDCITLFNKFIKECK